ncbi:hypothetical protein DSL92_05275 [Billgrantia gudaonensis]|uniref:Uncharacterized protein n=1 Tax=Billgrantia gudaonensis TaxID=376427 RepID=A0A432JIZ9_9GAMM|nr:hypothetical protein DSL92_05275 [Halomonas gudaonensis]
MASASASLPIMLLAGGGLGDAVGTSSRETVWRRAGDAGRGAAVGVIPHRWMSSCRAGHFR